ncbi:MAG: dehydrogenase [Spirochaetae bacterium HGW-Spirochaetae-4]|jgi:predicted molibdopterin-dependent oxidoreductase YjgC|nr:MAG: dehydrogenase [Spirochaetes bacterium GWC2_52_13]PKL21156.1 MAG: dehydrogenase [Spirochaetae bacterium HGW-Spirochaetae-4]HCG62577.1 dehydrogenase [Sphaerochaeta sp.]HCS37038.1 dehydrogenase [Sphaerochaeta sp.]
MQRIIEHPVLGPLPDVPMVKIIVDGEPMEAREGEMIAAALIATGKKYFRKTIKTHEPRGIYCGIGRCTDCVMTVNGIPNVRTCITPVEDGMVIETQMGYGVWKQEQ